MADEVYSVPCLCPGNSARSIFAACLMNRPGQGRRHDFSAAGRPKGAVHPLALHEFEHNNCLTAGSRSKDWEEFATPETPHMDFVFTVYDEAAADVCPMVWPGQPMTAHWGVADPIAVEGEQYDKISAFATAFRELQNRISLFVNLLFESLGKLRLRAKLDEVGRVRLADAKHPAA